MKIQIIKIPPSTVLPIYVSEELLNLVVSIASKDELHKIYPPEVVKIYDGEYIIIYEKLLKSLKKAKKMNAYNFFQKQSFGIKVWWFRKDFCIKV